MADCLPERLGIEQLRELARSLRARAAPDPKTAAAVAAALDSVALRRAERIARAQRLHAQLHHTDALRRMARWATTRF
ncbi:MAG: hypothetical protein EOP76_02065 [Variovorax sp.]|jgi:hypothetical protein|nr:MAG: hypothetical protein EOP76_02065 [Variovorax sp.]